MTSDTDRSERLAAALRANLQRRKAQARARREAPASTPAADPNACGGNPATGGSSAPTKGKPPIVPDGEPG